MLQLIEIIEIKEIVKIISTILGTLIATCTFFILKKSYLQPLKIETRKKQIAILSQLIELIRNKEYLLVKLEYNKVLINNTKKHLSENNLITPKLLEKENSFPYAFLHNNVKLIHVFEEDRIQKEITSDIKCIYLTETQFEFYNNLKNYSTNPFLPNEILTILNKIVSDIEINYGRIMVDSIKIFINDFIKLKKENIYNTINLDGIYTDYFVKKYLNHNDDLDELFLQIKKKLLIN